MLPTPPRTESPPPTIIEASTSIKPLPITLQSYTDNLSLLSTRNELYKNLFISFRDLNQAYDAAGSSDAISYGKLAVLDLEQSRLRKVYDAAFTSRGLPIDKTPNQILQDLQDLPIVKESGYRVFFHKYDVIAQKLKSVFHAPEGASFATFAYLLQKYEVDYNMLLPHFTTPKCFSCRMSTDRLPSMQKVMIFRIAEGFCTAQVCQSRDDPFHKAILIIMYDDTGANIPTGREDHVAKKPNNARLISRQKRYQEEERESWSEMLHHLDTSDLDSTEVNSQKGTYASLCLHMLQKSFYDIEQVKNNPFELVVPLIQVSAVHSSIWNHNILRGFTSNTTVNKIMSNGHNGLVSTSLPNESKVEKSYNLGNSLNSLSTLDFNRQSLTDLLQVAEIFFGQTLLPGQQPHRIISDINYVIRKHEAADEAIRQKLSIAASLATLQESRIGISQNRSVTRLTKLAFVFIPLSFITSTFGMNIDLLSTPSAVKWWTVLLGAIIIYALLAMPIFQLYPDEHPVKKLVTRHVTRGKGWARHLLALSRTSSSYVNIQLTDFIRATRMRRRIEEDPDA